ncbi:unnamed protein product [Medioppia subpectinata]|uniref:Uncharacterized protein n=1 Tax=Medioppia subpectinata TaxID=1979941 RepID=A0A7R9Q6R0_9ACAR|nr:unnamed protein product [Medioppia subpectinata]CAG2115136.1 unnamed protein product [Medioppia subpectinata]
MSCPITDTAILDKYQEVMDTNLRSIVYLTHLSVEHLEKTKGNIINMSSVAGLKPQLEARYSERGGKYPVGRVGESIDIANAILFLASDEASFVTGINFASDGGVLHAPY